jgi:hypothetical protein
MLHVTDQSRTRVVERVRRRKSVTPKRKHGARRQLRIVTQGAEDEVKSANQEIGAFRKRAGARGATKRSERLHIVGRGDFKASVV